MPLSLRSIVKNLVPPVVPMAWRCFRERTGADSKRNRFTGNYATWEDAARESDGYDTSLILERVRVSSGKVRDGLAAYERDGVTFGHVSHPFPLLACLLRVASACGSRLRVLDWGGSLGSTYFQCRPFLAEVAELRWNVVEQPHFVDVGRSEFQTRQLCFFLDMAECIAKERVDVVLMSGVLAYLPEPYRELGEIVAQGFPYVLLDRTPLMQDAGDRLTVQDVPSWIYGARVRYPAWFFRRQRIHAVMSRRYQLLAEFDGFDGTVRLRGGATARYVGQLWAMRDQKPVKPRAESERTERNEQPLPARLNGDVCEPRLPVPDSPELG